ncbi:hypothetical protein [Arthrobacter sp. UYCu712]|uniref:hypothetical protein n=1 Tax=Arthrobacter sp. UYCu712 TaxID=3156340 RepID=UPI0033970AC1
MAELAALPRFATFASQATGLQVQERPTSGIAATIPSADVVWTRRGASNLFDTVTTGPEFDGQIPGTGAFTGVQTSEDLTVIMFLHRRAGTTVRYFAQLSENGTTAGGMVIRNGTLAGECSIQPTQGTTRWRGLDNGATWRRTADFLWAGVRSWTIVARWRRYRPSLSNVFGHR